MTFLKKHMVLVVGGSIALVLALLVLVLLVISSSKYADIQGELRRYQATLENLHQRNPYPSIENLELVQDDLANLEQHLADTLITLSRQQPEIPPMQRIEFPPHNERTALRLRAMAARGGVRIPASVDFGFGRYTAGHLPDAAHVPRLLSQLQSIDRICTILIQSEVNELISVQREVFEAEPVVTREQAMPQRGGRQPQPRAEWEEPEPDRDAPPGVPGLYTKERFRVEFWASDEALREVLNRMASSDILMIVRNLQLRNELAIGGDNASMRASDQLAERLRPRVEEGRSGSSAPRQDLGPASQDDRVVAGRERIRVEMSLDVYRFEPKPVGEEELDDEEDSFS